MYIFSLINSIFQLFRTACQNREPSQDDWFPGAAVSPAKPSFGSGGIGIFSRYQEVLVIMNPIEKTIFARKRWIKSKMLAYGFRKTKDSYTLEKAFLDGIFCAVLSVDANGTLTGSVRDQMTQDDYYQLRQETADGAYVHTVRAAYAALLKDIAAFCCHDVLFASPQANRLVQNILDQFQVRPDFPWGRSERYSSYGTFRHSLNRKWFALIMSVTRAVLDKDDNPEQIDILNVKIRPEEADRLHQVPGIYPAYHMNHKLWISVALDDTVSDEAIMGLIETSYRLTRKHAGRGKRDDISR